MLQKQLHTVVRKVICLCLGLILLLPAMPGTAKQTDAKEKPETPVINPTPQHMKVTGKGFPLTPIVGLVVGDDTDQSAIDVVEKTLKHAGVKKIVRKKADESTPNTPITIWLGSLSDNPTAKKALKNATTEGLKKEGYVLATGIGSNKNHKGIILAGKDKTGTFYAAQTFAQLIQKKKGRDHVPSVVIVDWPQMPTRGAIEGFYGTPWSHEDRMDQMAFYGKYKFNDYIYAPKDDPYHREKWREPYPKDKLNQIGELVNKAKENHVNFTFAISPGNSICFSDDSDFQALVDKANSVWDKGVRSFAIFLDDINPDLRCDADKAMFGGDQSPAAAAQSYLLNRFNKEFIKTHEGAKRLVTVPTEYWQSGTSPYRERFADLVDQDVIVQWTGIGVVAPTITSEDAEKISGIFKHDLLIWDNYPVNDFDRNRLFLGPLVGRDADLTDHGVIGLTANPMNEAEASKIPLYTIADYTWNPDAYKPKKSWNRSIQAFGGDAADALKTFAENSYSSQLNDKESLTIAPLIEKFWDRYDSDNVKPVAAQLIKEFEKLQTVPEDLRQNLDNQNFLDEVAPYLKKLDIYGEAGKAAVKLKMAQKQGDDKEIKKQQNILESMMDQARAIPQKMSEGVIPEFLKQVAWGPNLALKQQVLVNNYWNNLESVNGEKAVDGDYNTRWATGDGVKSGWLEVTFPKEMTFNQTVLRECKQFGDRIQKYEIQYWDGSGWKTVHSGGVPKDIQIDKFEPVTAKKIRLNITSATFEPTIWEFEVYNTNF
ncbi:hyaluronoglucosaminidase [Scopulibacillus darangshiensis]|uniref:Hyaluronoglucosaminidase n=1 Tax=Scopulibacillus darangshiensis TaxID=442528 RepID=A0A4R2NJW7_9BACL|nr:beta-N-acetylglucosaminidase domain-containing protein [Scopulibacillus darangshiensis]TCP21869.1 hyaluronoglucosaminidase [Scopulibacillus darangshiensis]